MTDVDSTTTTTTTATTKLTLSDAEKKLRELKQRLVWFLEFLLQMCDHNMIANHDNLFNRIHRES